VNVDRMRKSAWTAASLSLRLTLSLPDCFCLSNPRWEPYKLGERIYGRETAWMHPLRRHVVRLM